MKKQFLKRAFVSFITCCFVMLVMARIAGAQYYNNNFNWGWGNFTTPQTYNYNYNYDDDDLVRGPHAYEVQETSGPGSTTYNYRQYTSNYDMMMGNIVPEMTISYSSSNPFAAMMNPFQPYESHSEGSGTGSLYPQTMMSFGSNPMMSYFAQQYAPRYEGYTSQSMFGNSNYTMNYPGMGNSGFMWGPYLNMNAAAWGNPNSQYSNYMY